MTTVDQDIPEKARDIAENIQDKVDRIERFLALLLRRRNGAAADVKSLLDDTIAGLEVTLLRAGNALAALAGKSFNRAAENGRPLEQWMTAMIQPTEINLQLMDYWITTLSGMLSLYDNPPVPLLEGEEFEVIRREHRGWIEEELRANSVARERAVSALAALKGGQQAT